MGSPRIGHDWATHFHFSAEKWHYQSPSLPAVYKHETKVWESKARKGWRDLSETSLNYSGEYLGHELGNDIQGEESVCLFVCFWDIKQPHILMDELWDEREIKKSMTV